MPAQSYLFDDAAGEDLRLRAQAVAFDPVTEHLFARAGLEPGMRVLDLGCGAGNVSELAARFVGPTGSVVGVDANADAVDAAGRLVGLPNVEFLRGDVRTLDGVAHGFDAVVGRAVLMYLADPVVALRAAAEHVRPGGLVCMHEPDMTYRWTSHTTPLWDKLRGWADSLLEAGGVDRTMGVTLHAKFREAGLPGPRVLVETVAATGAESPAFAWANALHALRPLVGRLDDPEAAEAAADPAALTERLDAEIEACDGVVLAPLLYGVWCRLPAA